MQSFEQYYEAFSLNPKDWINSLANNVNFLRKRQAKKKADDVQAQKSFAELKKLLESMGYTVGDTNDKAGSYHMNYGGKKEIGIKPATLRRKLEYIDDPVLSINNMRRLFVLAHEAGHAHQYDSNSNRIYSPDFERVIMEMLAKNPGKRKEVIAHLNDLLVIWEEIDAWITGMKFIPKEYHEKYKQYASAKYRSYLHNYGEQFFRTEPLIIDLLRRMDYEKHAMPSLKL